MASKTTAEDATCIDHGRVPTAFPSSSIPPGSTLIQSDTIMQPTKTAVSEERSLSVSKDAHSRTQPLRRSARIQNQRQQPACAGVPSNDKGIESGNPEPLYLHKAQSLSANPISRAPNRIHSTRSKRKQPWPSRSRKNGTERSAEQASKSVVRPPLPKDKTDSRAKIRKQQRQVNNLGGQERTEDPRAGDGGGQKASEAPPEREDFITAWLDSVQTPRTSPSSIEHPYHDKVLFNMPSPPDDPTTTSKKSERSTASVHDTDYHQSLRYRKIYVEREEPPMELMKAARQIATQPRTSSELDDKAIKKLKRKSRKLRNEAEDELIKKFARYLIPAMDEVPDERLETKSNQIWYHAVPIPLDPGVLTNPLPLPRPKPDVAFGYSEAAFNESEINTIDLLVDPDFGHSYAMPDKLLRFPFLDIEFKSQANGGTHHVATNQVAGTGAIAINAVMELIQRSFGAEAYDYNQPQFFSVTMDHQLACVNVHWVKAPAKGQQHSFHVEGLSEHLLKDPEGIRALVRSIENILDYGTGQRLQSLCEALDAYRQIVDRNRETVEDIEMT